MSVAMTLAAGQSCARTLLFESLHIQQFTGAVPHVMLVVDAVPGVLQKVLLEGYRRVMDEWNGCGVPAPSSAALLLPLSLPTPVPFGGAGLLQPPSARVSYSIAPFAASEFMGDMQLLQRFLRLCGPSEGCGGEGEAAFEAAFHAVSKYLQPLHQPPVDAKAFCRALRAGPARELLVFVLMQRSAFQNELQQYRLRLSLFDRGMRVVEHCHLESMSEASDKRAAAGDEAGALSEDQVYSYCRSCAFSPAVAEPFAGAIAEAIDFNAWRREGGETPAADDPPPALAAALQKPEIWEAFDPDMLAYGTVPGSRLIATGSSLLPDQFAAHVAKPVVGVGAPLQIVCRDAAKVITYSGGMEDCLANTGFYAAALEPSRNEVAAHRQRFPLEKDAAEEAEEALKPVEEVRGRMKKKEYIAMCRKTGQKPNPKRESDHEEEGMARLGGPEVGSRIASSIGGTFPIGEVISESFDLSKLNGRCDVFAYPDTHKNIAFSKPQPFEMTIDGGRVVKVSDSAPSDFVDLWTLVKQTEGECYVRELGIGLNPYVGKRHILADVTSFERQWGVHLSLGLRHPLFVKQNRKRNANGTVVEAVAIDGPVVKRKAGKFHIDVFVDAAQLICGNFSMDFTVPIRVP